MVIKVGMLGFSEGNGHPFSFSAIINGYDAEAFKACGWNPIFNYLEAQPKTAFDFSEIEVSHAWTPDYELTKLLCAATKIPHAVENFLDLRNEVDAIIIARDDYESHLNLAKPFLDYGLPVFIDKPLSLIPKEWTYFESFLHQGKLMSTSGLRYAKELDPLRQDISSLGKLKLIEGTVLFSLEKYGIHLLDAVASLNLGKPLSILRLPGKNESYNLELDSEVSFILNCLGAVSKTFHLSFFGSNSHQHFDLHDNFSAFKRCLKAFFAMVEHGTIPISPEETIDTMKLIYKAKTLQPFETIKLID